MVKTLIINNKRGKLDNDKFDLGFIMLIGNIPLLIIRVLVNASPLKDKRNTMFIARLLNLPDFVSITF